MADIFAAYADAFIDARGDAVSSAKRRVIRDVIACRTAALGGHVDSCDQCGYEAITYNSCRNRHCPKCQGAARAAWLEERAKDLLPVEYFHVVFTVPKAIGEIALQNKKVMYAILLRSSADTLLQIAADPKHLGAKIGFLSVLHTWNQTLLHHPHAHCVVPGGGLSPDGSRWIPCRPGFFLPVHVLSAVFRGKFLELTRLAFAEGKLSFQGGLSDLNNPERFAACLSSTYATSWVVYAKPPFGGPEQVLKYLACYTHRVAISNSRLISMSDGKVCFRYRDSAHANAQCVMELDAVEFIRRFLQHVLPKGFVRIRHYGLLANACRVKKLASCRALLSCAKEDVADSAPLPAIESAQEDDRRCPSCKKGRLIRRIIHRQPSILPSRQFAIATVIDSS